MVTITVIAVGKLKESFYRDACAEYQKRLSAYGRVEVIELPEHRLSDDPSRSEIEAVLSSEAEAIRARITNGSWVCVLTPEGTLCSSERLAERLAQVKLSGRSGVCCILGSSYGLDSALKGAADFRLSMSPMTFPHHLARVMLLEQLYRAESIQAGSRYHK